MERIAIIGLGRVGASMGLALKRWLVPSDAKSKAPEIEIVGFDYDVQTQQAAQRARAVDATGWTLPRVVSSAGLVVLAMPPADVRSTMQEIGRHLSDGAIVTDTSPYKQHCLEWASDLLPDHVSYIAGHPVLPNAEDRAPSADLFSGCTYALFPHRNADPQATETVVGMVQALGAKPYFPDPAEHDAHVAATSLLPVLASSALMHTVSYGAGWRDLKGIATSDLVQVTSLASMDPKQVGDMVELSQPDAVRWLESFIDRLGELRDLVARSDPEASEQVRRFFEDAAKARQRWLHPETVQEEMPSSRGYIQQMFLGRLGRRRPRER